MSLREEALRYLGYKGQKTDETILNQLDKNTELMENSVKPTYTYRIFDVKFLNALTLDGASLTLFGNDIRNHLNGAVKCAVLASTLGAKSEMAMRSLRLTSMSDAIIFDALCTAKIEAVTDECEAQIKTYAANHGYYTNFRYSPGYGDFPLSTQKDIIGALECEKKIGLTVTENFLLIPQKSVTAVIGLFENEPNINKKNCESCNLKDTCEFRKSGKTCKS